MAPSGDADDIRPRDFISGWKARPAPQARFLREQLPHLTWARVLDNTDGGFKSWVGPAIVSALLDAVPVFADKLAAEESAVSDIWEVSVSENERRWGETVPELEAEAERRRREEAGT